MIKVLKEAFRSETYRSPNFNLKKSKFSEY